MSERCQCGGQFRRLASSKDPARCAQCGMPDRCDAAWAKLEEPDKPVAVRSLDSRGPWTEQD